MTYHLGTGVDTVDFNLSPLQAISQGSGKSFLIVDHQHPNLGLFLQAPSFFCTGDKHLSFPNGNTISPSWPCGHSPR
jgi:hypothetical protein